jgi:hypothetical protein
VSIRHADARARAAEQFLNEFRMRRLLERQSGVGMPQAMQADSRDAWFFEQLATNSLEFTSYASLALSNWR